jgi:8-oxo-dGTP diphosphatase
MLLADTEKARRFTVASPVRPPTTDRSNGFCGANPYREYDIALQRFTALSTGRLRNDIGSGVSLVKSVDGLWYLANEAEQRAEQAHHRLTETYGNSGLQRVYQKHVSRDRFRTLASRIRDNGTPYGVQTLVRRDSGELLLVRHDGVDLWVLPGGSVEESESFRETAERELGEEAGIEALYQGLAMLNRVEISTRRCETWGILPVFRAAAETVVPSISDPDEEISAARWFDPAQLPADTRDRGDLIDMVDAIA